LERQVPVETKDALVAEISDISVASLVEHETLREEKLCLVEAAFRVTI